MESDAGALVVWWALPIGGALGAVARMLIRQRVEFPYLHRTFATRQLILVPGFLGEIALGVIAALVVMGAGAATFTFQSGFTARGFWGPLAASIVAGIAASETLNWLAKANLDTVEQELVEDAERRVKR